MSQGEYPELKPERRTGRSGWLVSSAAVVAGGVLVLAVGVGAAVMVGPVRIDAESVWKIVAHHIFDWPSGGSDRGWTAAEDFIVWEIRLPRALLGVCVGAGLAAAGATLQALVRNPLADPYVFGITGGASVGAALVLVLGVAVVGDYSLSASAFAGAAGATGLVVMLARSPLGFLPSRMILAGIAVSYGLSAITSVLVFTAANQGDQGAALSVIFWILGSLAGADWSHLALPFIVALLALIAFSVNARYLNALTLGDESAATLGVNVGRFRVGMYLLCALVTGVMVSVSGGIGFVGLVVPHSVRMVIGPDHRSLIPLSMLVGAVFLVWADVLARTLFAPAELPIGVITALTGTPFFIALLRSRSAPLGPDS